MRKEVLFGVIFLVFLTGIAMAENETNNPNGNQTNTTVVCSDSDSGKNYYVKGTTIEGGDAISIDNCLNSTTGTLIENYCDNSSAKYELYNCPQGCENGACIASNETNTTTIQCNEDDDCSDGYECEDGTCILEDDDNETETKICCKITKTEDNNETEIEYDFKDANDCSENETKKTREIVDNSFCVGKSSGVSEKNRIKFEERTGIECPEKCSCMGVVMKCSIGSGREMTVFAGKSGNIIVQIKGVNVTTNVTLYKENETIYGNFSNETKEIKILPDQAKERLRERIKTQLENENIQLTEEGAYKIIGNKKSRLFFIFSVNENVDAEIDSETGDTKVKSPWWGFLARDKKDM